MINITLKEILDQEEIHGSQKAAAEFSGIATSTWNDWRAKLLSEAQVENPDGGIEFPELEDDDITLEEIFDEKIKTYNAKKAHEDSWTWAKFKVQDDLPVGLIVIGDTHVDADGCNIPKLKHDLELAASTEGVQCINIGDLHNNWCGPLSKLYGDQNMSKKRAYRMVKGILTEMGVPWMLHLVGNHDAWGDGHEVLKNMGGKNLFKDWQAKIEMEWKSGGTIRINAAHNFKGSSMYSKTHGASKRAIMDGDSDVYLSGHIHTHAMQSFQLDGKDRCVFLGQVGSYKEFDDFARRGGFSQCTVGASIMVVLDPYAEDQASKAVGFADLDRGAIYLKALREHYEQSND